VGPVELRIRWVVFGTFAALVFVRPLPAMADPPERPMLGISELKVGALYHDIPGLWSGFGVERPAVDANFEVLFAPWARTFGGYLRPAIGATVNFNGDTSKAYADLRWEAETASGVFFAIGMGAAIHNGDLSPADDFHKALGSRVLFHPSAEIGYRFDGVNSISIFADHVSNGFTQRYNEGMDTVGIRYGRKLGPVLTEVPSVNVPVGDFSGLYVGAFAGYQYETADWYAPTPISSVHSSFAWGDTRDTTGSPARASSAWSSTLRRPSAASLQIATPPGSRAEWIFAASTAHALGSGGSSTASWSMARVAWP
jgi:lipid A 3-O-deacylase